MLHPLFSTLVHRPDLVADHVSAYAALLHTEASQAGAEMMRRAVAWALVGAGALLCAVFAGVALMLGLLMAQFHWVLVAVPGLFLLVTVLAYARARAPMPSTAFSDLKAQFDSDVQVLRSVR
jgi:protein-S-isoprenylcysteine O-methyltransferase Ste14